MELERIWMRVVVIAFAVGLLAAARANVERLAGNPIITPASSATLGDNINGPSLVRVPDWVDHPIGKYYLYFSHHAGRFIRLAYADRPAGPWTVHEPGTLRLEDAPQCFDHIASPDVHVDQRSREILMYFHCPSGGQLDSQGRVDINEQRTYVATSRDGLRFVVGREPLGPAYFRVFRWKDAVYAIVRGGGVLRSKDGRSPFEPGPTLIPPDGPRVLRHAAVDIQGNLLRIYYSRIGDEPERILRSDVQLIGDWREWRAATPPEEVLRPETAWEGSDRPLEASQPDEARGRVRQLRDPGVFVDLGRRYLLYSIAGESGLAIGALR